MANELPGPGGFLVTTNMTTPSGSLTVPVTTRGVSMDPHTVVPLLPGMTFNAAGKGRFELGTRVSGLRGSIDLFLDMSATGTARTICYLTDSLTSPTNYLAVRIDASNRPRVNFTNSSGVVQGSVTPSYAALAANQRSVTVRFCWDSTAIVSGTRFASLRVNREFIPDANWATNPIAAWAGFKPSYLVLGASLGDADFNGTVLAVQISDTVAP